MSKKEKITEEEVEVRAAEENVAKELDDMKELSRNTLQKIKENVREEDPKLSPAVTLRSILGGDFLSADLVRGQIGVFLLIVLFSIVYVAFRYQCQQDMIKIAEMENRLQDAKYKAMSCASTLTERSRESRVLEILRQQKDSVLKISDQPPYLINVPED